MLSCCTPCFSSNYLISVGCWIKIPLADPACLEWQNWSAEPRVSHTLQPDTLIPLSRSPVLSLALPQCVPAQSTPTCDMVWLWRQTLP